MEIASMEDAPDAPQTEMQTEVKTGTPAQDSEMRMSGTPGNILIGPDLCGAYKDALGNYKERTVSTICWVSIVIVVICAMGAAKDGYKLMQQAKVLKAMMKMYSAAGSKVEVGALSDFAWYAGLTYILVAVLAAIIIYYHCTRCNGGTAFMKLMGLLVLCYAVLKFMWNRKVDEFLNDNSLTDEEQNILGPVLKSQI